jgi:hypothetical protein
MAFSRLSEGIEVGVDLRNALLLRECGDGGSALSLRSSLNTEDIIEL